MIFIRATGRNNLDPKEQQYNYTPDVTFEKEQNLIDYLKTKQLIKFKAPSTFGFSSVEKSGYLVSEKVHFQNKDFKNNAIFILNSEGTKLKETIGLDFVDIIKDTSKENTIESIEQIRNKAKSSTSLKNNDI